MKRIFTVLSMLFLLSNMGFAQVYLDHFDNDDPAFMGGATAYSFEEKDSELTISSDTPGPFDAFTYQLHIPDNNTLVPVDATENNKLFVRAKASSVGTQLRIDLKDADGYVTSTAGITQTLNTDYKILEFDFTNLYSDGGFGGSPCTSGPCPVDGTNLVELVMFTDPGIGGFNGKVVIDYIAFGKKPDGPIVSDIYQDHFDADSSLTSFIGTATYGMSLSTDTELTISGDGSNPMWDPLTYVFRTPPTWDPVDIDVTGNHKMYIKIKSTVPSTTIRIDLVDIDGYANTQGSITKLVGTDYSVIEFDYAGTYSDLGYGGTPCDAYTAPCDVDGTRVAQLNIFIEPGVGQFLGELTVDYLSFDIPLEPAGPPADLIYQDHFDNSTLEYTDGTSGLTITEMDSDLIIEGDGSAPIFSAVSYLLHDKDIDEQIFLNMAPAQDKIYVRARTEMGSVPLRIDVLDTTGLTSNQASLTKIISDQFETFEYNFTGNYFDGGFGGTPCTTGPCELDAAAISQLLIYPDPVAGAYMGKVYIDFISIGQPAVDPGGPTGKINYSDNMDDATIDFVSDVTGLVSTFTGDEWTITGDGTGEMWASINYAIHEDMDLILANAVGSSDKLFVRAKTSVAGTELRVDLQDNEGYLTNAAAVSNALTEDYQIFEIDFSSNYNDGGFGGSPCTAGPCPVDGKRVSNLQFFANPGVGQLNGTITIDWVSFGQPFDPGGPTGIINYADQFDDNTSLFLTDNTGLVSTTGEIWTITGDGTNPAYAPVSYDLHDDGGELVIADAVGSNDKLFIRAKASEAMSLRIDLQDNQGYVTNANAKAVDLTTDFVVYELSYAGAYSDGGFGGTPCMSGPCPMDGQRVESIQVFANADDGGFEGTVEIDWLSFGQSLSVGVQEVSLLNSLIAFPNPAQDELNVAIEVIQSGDFELAIFNGLGQLERIEDLGQVNVGKTVQSVDVSQLPKGLYSISITIDGVYAGFLKFVK